MHKRGILYILLALGLVLIGSGVWLIFCLPEAPSPVATDNVVFNEDFAFRGKLVSLEEAGNLIGARLPVPSYLPEGYALQEIYAGVGNSTVIMLISKGPIEKIDREPPDKPKDYPIHLVKCEVRMYISFTSDLRMVGGNPKPTPINMEFHEMSDGNVVVYWSAEVEGKVASLMMIAEKDMADKEELTKIAQSTE
jgi:hypothetical protein